MLKENKERLDEMPLPIQPKSLSKNYWMQRQSEDSENLNLDNLARPKSVNFSKRISQSGQNPTSNEAHFDFNPAIPENRNFSERKNYHAKKDMEDVDETNFQPAIPENKYYSKKSGLNNQMSEETEENYDVSLPQNKRFTNRRDFDRLRNGLNDENYDPSLPEGRNFAQRRDYSKHSNDLNDENHDTSLPEGRNFAQRREMNSQRPNETDDGLGPSLPGNRNFQKRRDGRDGNLKHLDDDADLIVPERMDFVERPNAGSRMKEEFENDYIDPSRPKSTQFVKRFNPNTNQDQLDYNRPSMPDSNSFINRDMNRNPYLNNLSESELPAKPNELRFMKNIKNVDDEFSDLENQIGPVNADGLELPKRFKKYRKDRKNFQEKNLDPTLVSSGKIPSGYGRNRIDEGYDLMQPTIPGGSSFPGRSSKTNNRDFEDEMFNPENPERLNFRNIKNLNGTDLNSNKDPIFTLPGSADFLKLKSFHKLNDAELDNVIDPSITSPFRAASGLKKDLKKGKEDEMPLPIGPDNFDFPNKRYGNHNNRPRNDELNPVQPENTEFPSKKDLNRSRNFSKNSVSPTLPESSLKKLIDNTKPNSSLCASNLSTKKKGLVAMLVGLVLLVAATISISVPLATMKSNSYLINDSMGKSTLYGAISSTLPPYFFQSSSTRNPFTLSGNQFSLPNYPTTTTMANPVTTSLTTIQYEITCKSHSVKINSYTCKVDLGYGGDGAFWLDLCGITMTQPHSLETGLRPELNHSWPSTVLIIFEYKGTHNLTFDNQTTEVTFRSNCTGTLIDRETVLTVASCFIRSFNYSLNGTEHTISVGANECYTSVEAMYTVYAGVNDIKTAFFNTTFVQKRKVRRIIMHENYDNKTLMNDIALLKLDDWFYLDDTVQIACLPYKNYSFYPLENKTYASVGWGNFDYNLTNFLNVTLLRNATNETNELLEYEWNGQTHYYNIFTGVSSLDVQFNVNLNSFNISQCENILPSSPISNSNYNNSNLTFHDLNSQFCIGQLFSLNETITWPGNFYPGASLFIQEDLIYVKTQVIAGLFSYGHFSRNENTSNASYANYGIYTKVSNYKEWIENHFYF